MEQDSKARAACTRSDIICDDNYLFINTSPDIGNLGKFAIALGINCYVVKRCASLVVSEISDPVA